MASNHTGTATPTPGAIAPSPAPAPGVAPVTSIPADVDPNNVATMFAQQYPALADYVAYLQAAARVSVPVAPGGSSGFGFGAVSHVGGGTGTITPSGYARFGYYCVVKIIGAGGLGVGTFQFSSDGGATYGATTTIPGGGTYTDATGVKVTFAGTFTATDTYAFRSADAPRQMWHAPSGRARELIDHLGYPLGQITAFREDWSHGTSGGFVPGSSLTLWPSYPRWSYTLETKAVDPSIVISPPDSNGNFNSLLVTNSSTAGSIVNEIYSTYPVLVPSSTSHAEFAIQWLVRVPSDAASLAKIQIGLAGSFSGSHPFNAIFERAASGNWFAVVNDDTTSVLNADSGIGPNTGPGADWQLLRLEYYGPSSQVGSAIGDGIWRFLIDGEEVGIAAYSPLTFSGAIHMRINDTGNATPTSVGLGPVSWGVNWLDDPVRM